MKIKVEAELDIDLKAFNITELRKILSQLLSSDKSKVIKETKITHIELLSNPLDG
jgi:hypothetical protein